ncbi:MAG: TonB-dependent receptor [Muribaculaceae bacterium]|nr:TonB-dependent receptor [Muribaculaceae bacterium]
MKINIITGVILISGTVITTFAQEPVATQEPVITQESGKTQKPVITQEPVIIEDTDSLQSNYTDLEEFVITQKKDIVKSDGATLTYDLDQDTSSKGTNVLDALRKVPMISVDGQDNIRVKGDSNFRIYVNGKEEPMLTANASQILKAMPAESVSKIEVIAEPGAKYDAEGTGGIINLITERQQRKDGYAGTLSAQLGARNEGVSAYGRVKYDKITADANINYADNAWLKQTNSNTTETTAYNSENAYRTLQETSQEVSFHYLGAGLNLSWEPSDNNLFTISGNFYQLGGKLCDLNNDVSTWTRDGQLTSRLIQNADGSLSHLGVTGSGSYKRTFGERGHHLIGAYAFNFGRQSMDLKYHNDNSLNMEGLPEYERNSSYGYNREHTLTIDYTIPLSNSKHIIETGTKGVFRWNTADAGNFTGNSEGDLIPNPDNSTETRQIQDIYAVYASYSGNYGKIALKAGIRYEHTYMGMDFLKGIGDDYRRHLNDVAPNAALTYLFGPASNLRLAYQMRISRPSLEQMNPFRFEIIQNEVRMGNPYLDSEKYHNLSLIYSNYGITFGGNIGLEASQSNNTIEEYVYFDNNIRYETYANMGHRRTIALSGFFNWNVTQHLSLSVNGMVDFTDIKSGDGTLGNHGWNGNYGANINYTGPWKMKYSIYGGQSTGNISLQGKWYGWYYYGIGISRNFLKNDALTIAVNASNFFAKYNHYKGKTYTPDHSQTTRGKNPSWNVGLSVSWNFGHLTEQVKRTEADLENIDTKQKDKGQGGSGFGL